MRLTVTASCMRCDWPGATGPGAEWDKILRAAEKHTKSGPGHPTITTATPAGVAVITTARPPGLASERGQTDG